MKSTTKKVVVAMSGGVDSSVAAALLKKQGYDVIGITMQIWDKGEGGCCSISAVEDARRVANKLGIPHYVLNFRKAFKDSVIRDFISEYRNGRTPNPCVRCNQLIKFDLLLRKAKELGADYLATGHYARVSRKNGRYVIQKAKDRHKDQSYFLYSLTQEALSHALFPVGGLTKPEVRKIAREIGLSVADKKESQEICFVEGSYKALFKPKEGVIVDLKGKVLGEHDGCHAFTIGQRRGLGVALGKPSYVVKISPKTNKITIGNKGDVYGDDLIASRINLVSLDKLTSPMKVSAKIRYNNAGSDAKILPMPQGKVRVMFKVPQFAITPGQSVVFYDGDNVVGGGIIE